MSNEKQRELECCPTCGSSDRKRLLSACTHYGTLDSWHTEPAQPVPPIQEALREAIDCYKDLLRELKYPHVGDHAAVCKWEQVLRASSPAVAPADTPVCSKCKTRLKYLGNEIEPCVNCCEAVAGRMQGDEDSGRTKGELALCH
jgi:ribosomal protein L37AE/L43A